jgi:hypothetical protein
MAIKSFIGLATVYSWYHSDIVLAVSRQCDSDSGDLEKNGDA